VERHEHSRGARVLEEEDEGVVRGEALLRKGLAPRVETEGERRRRVVEGDGRGLAGAQLPEEAGGGCAEDVQERLAAGGPFVPQTARRKGGAVAGSLESQPLERALAAGPVFPGSARESSGVPEEAAPFGEVFCEVHRLPARLDLRPRDVLRRGEEEDLVKVDEERGVGPAGIEAEEPPVRRGTARDRDEVLSRHSGGSRECGDRESEDPGTGATPEEAAGKGTSNAHVGLAGRRSSRNGRSRREPLGGAAMTAREPPGSGVERKFGGVGPRASVTTVDYLVPRRSP
jgi:hypothetical protein